MSFIFKGVCFYLGVSLISFPVYLAILYVIVTHRRHRVFRSSFYALTLSNGIFDLTSAALFIVLECFPHLPFARETFWNNRTTYLPTFSLGTTFMLLFIRVTGIASLILERAAETFYRDSLSEKLINRPLCCLSTIFRWMTSLIMAWPIFIQMEISYVDSDGDLLVNIPANDMEVDVWLASGVVGSCALICTLCCILMVLRLVAKPNASIKHHNCSLTLQTLGIYATLLAMTVHCCIIQFQSEQLQSAVKEMTGWFFFYNAFLTFIHPWMILLLNNDVRKRLTSLGSSSVTDKSDQILHVTRIPISFQ